MIQDGLAMIFGKFIRALVIAMAVGTPAWAQAQQLIGSYVALLSEADHFNSSGQRLTSAAAIIRQDRANFHRFGIKDPQDEGDTFFADEGNRAALEQMLERGRAEPGVIARIVNGTPLIRVDIYRAGSGPFIKVTLIDRQQPAIRRPCPTTTCRNMPVHSRQSTFMRCARKTTSPHARGGVMSGRQIAMPFCCIDF